MLFSTIIEISDISFKIPPDFPIKEITFKFLFFASLAASTNDIEAPDFWSPPPVDIKNRISPLFPCASTCLLKKLKKPKSLHHAVTAAGKLAREIADIGSLERSLYVHCNSPTKCSASEQEPPLPATSNFFFLFLL